MPESDTMTDRLARPARLGALMAALALPSAAAAQQPEITDFELDNGMQVVVIEDHRAPVVVHMVWYRAGSADEPPGTSGIAHYLEHLLFKGTDDLEAGEFSETVAANGGTDNAFTSYDYTAYFQRVAADRLGLMMEMEADRMVDLDIRQEDILVERDVVIEERAQRTDSDPGALLGEQRSAAQYLNHPYGRPIIGWRHETDALTLEDALDFYEAHYAPDNAVVVVAGDVEPDEVRALAEEHYGPLEPNGEIAERERPQEPPQVAARRIVMEDARVGQPYVARTYLAPGRDSGAQEEAAALTILARILGGSPTTSVLGQKLQFDTGEAVWTSAFYSGVSLDDTTFSLVIVPAEGVSLADAEAALDREVAAFIEEGVDPAQLERIKFQLRASQVYEGDDVAATARRYGAALTSGLTIEDVDAWPDLLQAVTAEEVIEAARAVFDPKASVTSWLTRPEGVPAPAAAPAPPAEAGDASSPAVEES